MARRDRLEGLVLEPVDLPGLEQAWAAERGVGDRLDASGRAEGEEIRLRQAEVELDLVRGWRDRRAAEEVVQHHGCHVGDADGPHETLFDETLHGGPGLVQGHVAPGVLAVTRLREEAAGAVEGHARVLPRDRPMHEQLVEVVRAQ